MLQRATRPRWKELLPWLILLLLVSGSPSCRQGPLPGKAHFESRCTRCHGADGAGGEFGPGIVSRLPALNAEQLQSVITAGLPNRGMPGFKLDGNELKELVAYLRTMPRPILVVERGQVRTTNNETLDGLVLNQTFEDMQLQTGDGRVHLLRKAGDLYRAVTSDADWTNYDGRLDGHRYTTLNQINHENVSRLSPRWVFSLPNNYPRETTPVVADGIMYLTSVNECWALDAGSGRQIWHYQQPRTSGLVGDAARGINRGAAVAGNHVFMVTDHAHVIALNRLSGKRVWDTEMADWHQNYSANSAPLAVGNLVISGTAGGDFGVRGFLAAFDQSSGKEVWRFWTTPARGEPGAETWKGTDIDHSGAVAWFTGSYDVALETVYWQIGNPGNNHNGDQRVGDNLYSDSVVALDAKTGKLRWHYQFTPHDLWDWDAAEPLALVDADWEGQPRKLLLQANRNGFFYVLDRTTGKLLLAKQFVTRLTWATGIGADGRPLKLPNIEPTPQGTQVCPDVWGATNWYSTSYNPVTGLYYVQTTESCGIYIKGRETWKVGKSYEGGTTRRVGDPPERVLRALDIHTGKIAWELPQKGRTSWGGVLSTVTGLLFVCEDSGAFVALDSLNGRLLWSFQTSQIWKASPMTYRFDGKQYVSVAAGPNIFAFALPE